jgi:hypothetical protein
LAAGGAQQTAEDLLFAWGRPARILDDLRTHWHRSSGLAPSPQRARTEQSRRDRCPQLRYAGRPAPQRRRAASARVAARRRHSPLHAAYCYSTRERWPGGPPCVPRGSSAAFSCASARRALLARRGRDVGGQEAREVVGQVGVAAEEARHRRVRLRCARLVRAVRRKQLQEGGVGARLALKGAQKPREGVREEARPLGTRGFGPSRRAAAAGGARLEPRLDGGHEAERVVQRHAAGARLAGRLREWGGRVSPAGAQQLSAVRGHNGATERGRAGRRVRPARASQLAQPEAPRGALRPLLSGQPLL